MDNESYVFVTNTTTLKKVLAFMEMYTYIKWAGGEKPLRFVPSVSDEETCLLWVYNNSSLTVPATMRFSVIPNDLDYVFEIEKSWSSRMTGGFLVIVDNEENLNEFLEERYVNAPPGAIDDFRSVFWPNTAVWTMNLNPDIPIFISGF